MLAKRIRLIGPATCFLFLAQSAFAFADEEHEIALGSLKITTPKEWVRKKPRSRIIEHEFAVPKSEDDENDGRLTSMSAGGGIEANIQRWYSQFTQPDGGSTEDAAKLEKIDVAGREVHLVDISGTFTDQAGPMDPGVEREKYRMLAAIIVTDESNFFIKFYGPRQTVADNEDEFLEMIKGLEKK